MAHATNWHRPIREARPHIGKTLDQIDAEILEDSIPSFKATMAGSHVKRFDCNYPTGSCTCQSSSVIEPPVEQP